MYFQTHIKISFAVEKFPESLETSRTIQIYSLMKNSFQTHINILDCLEKFPVLWKSFQKFCKTFQTIFFIISWKTAFKPTSIFYIVWKISFPLEKFKKNLENFQDNMNLLFNNKKKTFNTLFNILVSVEKFHLTWSSGKHSTQYGKQFSNTHYYLR